MAYMRRLKDELAISSDCLSSSGSSASASSKKKPAEPATPFKPYKMLFPLKEPRHDSGKKEARKGATTVVAPQMKWVGMTPLDMVVKVVSLAEAKSPNFGAGLHDSPTLRQLLTAVDESCSTCSGKKRKADRVDEEVVDANEDGDDVAEALVASVAVELPGRFFKTFRATHHVAALDKLVKEFKAIVRADETKVDSVYSYNRAQESFASQVAAAEAGRLSMLVVANNALAQMRALVEMVKAPAEPERRSTMVEITNEVLSRNIPSPFKADALTLPEVEGILGGSIDLRYLARVKSTQKSRDTFQSHMNAWMRNNFTNPFPDEPMLRKLALFLLIQARCISFSTSDQNELKSCDPTSSNRLMVTLTMDKILTWLTNVRARRWRKAIETGFNARRPAALLLEDSVRLYDGKDVRKVRNWDGEALFGADSLKRKTWKQEKKEKKASSPSKAKVRKSRSSSRRKKAPGTKSDEYQSSSSRKKASGAKSEDVLSSNNPKVATLADITPICTNIDRLMAAADIISKAVHSPSDSHNLVRSTSDEGPNSEITRLPALADVTPTPDDYTSDMNIGPVKVAMV